MKLQFKIEATPSDFSEKFNDLPEKMQSMANSVHRANVFYCLEAMLLWMRVDTGRLRGSFLPFMDKYQHNYQRSLGVPTLAKQYSMAGVEEGKALGDVLDEPLDTTITSNVEYAQPLDKTPGMFDQNGFHSMKPAPFPSLASAVIIFEQFFQTNFDAFLDQNIGGMKSMDEFLRKTVGMGIGGEIDLDFGQPV